MTILASEVKFYQPDERSDASTNGGRMTSVESVSNTDGNLFPDVPQSERIAGSTKFRKQFTKVASAGNEILFNTYQFFNQYTPGDDLISFFQTAAPEDDTQADILGSEDHYGCGKLNATVLAGVNAFDVLVEDASVDTIFRDGDTIRITDKQSLAGGGNEEIHVIDTVTFLANVASITIVGVLASGYSDTDTFVSSGLPVGDIGGTFDSFVVTSAGSGTYDEILNPVIVDSIGGVEDDWTLTFTSPTAFDIVGALEGAVGSGSVSGGASPDNTDFTAPYFTLASAGFGGVWAASDTITFSTHAASTGIWYKRTVPAGAASLSGDFVEHIIKGENV